MTGYFGSYTAARPTNTRGVIRKFGYTKYTAKWPTLRNITYSITYTSKFRGFDICMPVRASIAGVKLCSRSDTGIDGVTDDGYGNN